jgi:acyl-CoA thioesterase I
MSRRLRYGLAALLVHCIAAAPAAAGPLIWAFGDSLTEGYGLPPNQGFTVQLQAALRRRGVDAVVANGGVSGDTTRQALARLRWGLRGLPRAPDLVIVELGANDMLRGLPPAEAERNLDAILAELARRRLPVLLTGMRASANLGPDYRRAFDALYPRLAAKWRVRFYPFFYDGVVGQAALIQADGLHPNARGVQIIVNRLVPAAMAALPRRQTSSSSAANRSGQSK